MKQIQFLGASGTVTGSSYKATSNTNQQILIDLGMFQGSRDNEALNFSPLPFDAKHIQTVLLTHAHLDHCGRLPLLVKNGFKGKVYMTDATAQIMQISLRDAASLEEDDKKNPQLFTKEDVNNILEKVEIVQYDTPITLDNFICTFRNAGHILGSASIEIQESDGSVTVFSGDLGNASENLIKPAAYIDHADTVIMESTYGNTIHPQEDPSLTIQKEIETIGLSGGVLLIPAFSIERTQEILFVIHQLFEKRKIDTSIPIFLDSPMAIEVTEVFKKFRSLYSDKLSSEPHPFEFPSLILTKAVEESKKIQQVHFPKIIIAGSGMMSGGRILHHTENYISNPSTRILIVGYQAEGTLGREILNGARQIHVYDRELSVQATVTKLETFSSHADVPELLKWLGHIKKVKNVFLVHGEDPQRVALKSSIEKALHIPHIVLPMRGQTYEIN